MAFDPHANLAVSAVSTAPSPPTSGTSLTVNAGHGARFPAVPFNATVWPVAVGPTPANAEIIRVTARTTDTLTILRAQEGTTARAIGSGDQIAATITAKTLTDVETEFATVARVNAANTFTANQTVSGSSPWIMWIDSSQPANSRVLYWTTFAQEMLLVAADDAYATQTAPLTLTRPGDLKAWRDLYEKQRTTAIGHWVPVPFNAGNFIASTGTWTVTAGQVTRNRYTLIGKTLCWQLWITGSSLSVANTYLYLTAPVPCVGSTGNNRVAYCLSVGTTLPAVQIYLDPGSGLLLVSCPPGTPTLAAGTLDVSFTTWLEIQ